MPYQRRAADILAEWRCKTSTQWFESARRLQDPSAQRKLSAE